VFPPLGSLSFLFCCVLFFVVMCALCLVSVFVGDRSLVYRLVFGCCRPRGFWGLFRSGPRGFPGPRWPAAWVSV